MLRLLDCGDMILNRLLKIKPKWQHSNPAVRQQAIQELDSSDPILRQLAQDDQEPQVRQSALAKINDFGFLQSRASADSAASVKEYANNRLFSLLSGQADDAPDLAQRLDLLSQTTPEVLQQLAQEGTETEVRQAALEQLDDEALYAERVLNDSAAPLRLAALSHIQRQDLLETIARQARNRDKRISRGARERLQAIQEQTQRQHAIEQTCRELETLSWDGETGPNAARYALLIQQWQDLQNDASPELQARFSAARRNYAEHFKASAATRAQRQTLCERLQSRLTELQSLQQLDPNEAKLERFLSEINQAWQATGVVADAEARRLQREFDQLKTRLEQQQQRLSQNYEQSKRMRLTLADAEFLLARSGQVLQSDLTELEQRWQHLPRPEAKSLQQELNQQFEHLLQQLRQRLQRQIETKAEEEQALQSGIDELEQALDAGELQHALDMQKRLRQLFKQNISLSRRQMNQLEQRLQAAAGTIARLNGWRRWGTNQAREHLIEALEELPAQELEPRELARQVKAARQAWKDMNTAGSASHSVWKRFDAACERAYQPAQDYFQDQAKQREQNLHQRQQLCLELEQIEKAGNHDWYALSKFLQKVQQRWRQMGSVNRADRKAIDRRFNQLLQSLQQQLQPHLDRELERRKDLIAKARQLAESEDNQAAVQQIKALQNQWKPQVLAPQRQEQKLWQEFRAACDTVFARRQTEQQALKSVENEKLNQRKAITSAILELAQREHDNLSQAEIEQIKTEFKTLRAQWQNIGSPPRNAQTSSEQAYKRACTALNNTLAQQTEQLKRAQLDALQQRAHICRQLEAQLQASSEHWSEQLQAARIQWQSLAPVGLSEPIEQAINQRFERICQALEADTQEPRTALLNLLQQQEAERRELRRELCLRMEIATQVESPEEFAQERMEYQVARLSQSLSAGHYQESTDAATIAEQWFLIAGAEDNLEQRFQRAYQALFKS